MIAYIWMSVAEEPGGGEIGGIMFSTRLNYLLKVSYPSISLLLFSIHDFEICPNLLPL